MPIILETLSPKKQDTPLVIADPKFCHLCNQHQLDPENRVYLPNGVEVCAECFERSQGA